MIEVANHEKWAKQGRLARFRERRLARTFLQQLLYVDLIRYLVAVARFLFFRSTRGINVLPASGAIAPNTVMHNLKGLSAFAVKRSSLLLRPLTAIELVRSQARVLSIGPRTEGELLNLVAHGFAKGNVRGLDLISYSPWIDLGDMHQLPYDDDSWDIVIIGWVLAYSDDQKRASEEVVRVLRPGGFVAVGVEYCPLTTEEIVRDATYLPGSEQRLMSLDQILGLFGNSVGTVYFRHDLSAAQPDRSSSMVAIFSVAKEDAN